MKTSTLLIVLLFLTSVQNAANKSTSNFVIIGDKTYYCDDVHVGKTSTKIFTDGRKYFKVPTFTINAYAQEGRYFEYLPVVNSSQDTTGWTFMQLIATRDGSRLYHYCSNCLKYDPLTGIIAPALTVYRYYIYKGGNLQLISDDKNSKAQLNGFGVKVVV